MSKSLDNDISNTDTVTIAVTLTRFPADDEGIHLLKSNSNISKQADTVITSLGGTMTQEHTEPVNTEGLSDEIVEFLAQKHLTIREYKIESDSGVEVVGVVFLDPWETSITSLNSELIGQIENRLSENFDNLS